MPMPNYHSFRLHDPSKYDHLTYLKHETKGVDQVLGWTSNGKSEIQAVRFDKNKFDMSKAKQWMKDHNMSAIKVEKAKTTNESIIEKINSYLIEKELGIQFVDEELNEVYIGKDSSKYEDYHHFNIDNWTTFIKDIKENKKFDNFADANGHFRKSVV